MSKRGVLTKACAKSESEVAGMERYDEEEERVKKEEERAKKEYEKHKCKTCVWAKWQAPYIVSCLFPRCVKEEGREIT